MSLTHFYVLFSVTRSFLLGLKLWQYYSEQQDKLIHEPISVSKIIMWYLHKNIVIPLLCQYELFMHTCVSKNAIVSKHVIFYLLRYNVIKWSSHIYRKYSFLSFHSLLFLVNNTGKVTELNWQCETLVNGMMQVTYCMVLGLICCLFVTLLYIERKWLLMRDLATVLPSKSKLSGKFQRFNTVNGSMEMLINSWISKKFKLKWTILKHFKQWAP